MPFSLTGGAIPAPPEWFTRRSRRPLGRLRVSERVKAVWCELRLSPAVASDKAAAEYDYEGER